MYDTGEQLLGSVRTHAHAQAESGIHTHTQINKQIDRVGLRHVEKGCQMALWEGGQQGMKRVTPHPR